MRSLHCTVDPCSVGVIREHKIVRAIIIILSHLSIYIFLIFFFFVFFYSANVLNVCIISLHHLLTPVIVVAIFINYINFSQTFGNFWKIAIDEKGALIYRWNLNKRNYFPDWRQIVSNELHKNSCCSLRLFLSCIKQTVIICCKELLMIILLRNFSHGRFRAMIHDCTSIHSNSKPWLCCNMFTLLT